MNQIAAFQDVSPVIDTLCTHSGRFHADDLLTYGVLSTLHPHAILMRTRDAALIDALEGRTIIFDVGSVHDASRGRFDHHQPGRSLRADGVPYSSLGLVWRAHGRDFLAAALPEAGPDLEALHAQAQDGFVRNIDACDNGAPGDEFAALRHPMSLSALLENLAPDLETPDQEAEDAAFRAASKVAMTLFLAALRKTLKLIRSEAIVQHAVETRSHPNWIELPRMMPYISTLLDMGADDIHYVVGPNQDEWHISAVNTAHDSFDCRRPLPESWAGLRDEALRSITGVKDARFCHLARFIAVADSRDGAMALLEQALAA